MREDDTEGTLHERIKVEERELLVELGGQLGRGELPLPGR